MGIRHSFYCGLDHTANTFYWNDDTISYIEKGDSKPLVLFHAFPFNALDHIIQPRLGEVRHKPCEVIHTAMPEEGGRERRQGGRGPLGLGILGGEGAASRERGAPREGLFGRERR